MLSKKNLSCDQFFLDRSISGGSWTNASEKHWLICDGFVAGFAHVDQQMCHSWMSQTPGFAVTENKSTKTLFQKN